MIIDLTNVDFLASLGMSVLIETHERLDGSIPLTVVADGPATSRPMTLIGLADFITMHSPLDTALEGLKTGDDDSHLRK